MSARSESSNEVRETFKLKLTVGHDALLLKNKNPKMTHRWRVFVEGTDGNIAPLVDRMVFHLHPSFDNPIREVEKPPFEITESGFGMFTMKIEIFFFGKPIELYYELVLMTNRDVKSVSTKIVSITNPLPYIRKLLVDAGGKNSCDSNGLCEENSEVQNPKDVQGCISSKKKKKSKDDDVSERERKPVVASKPKQPVKTISRSGSCTSLSSLSSLSPTISDDESKKMTEEKEEMIIEKKKKKMKEKKITKEKKSEKVKPKTEKVKSESKIQPKVQSMSTQSTPKKQFESESKDIFPGTSLPKVASFAGLSSKEEKKHKKKDPNDSEFFTSKEEIDVKKNKKERKELRLNDKPEEKKRKENEKDRNEGKEKERSETKSSDRSVAKSATVKDTLSHLFGSLADDENANEISQSSPEAMMTSSPTYQQPGPLLPDAGVQNEEAAGYTKPSTSNTEFQHTEQSLKKKKEKRKKEKKADNDDSSRREYKAKHHKKESANSQDSSANDLTLHPSGESISMISESPSKIKKLKRKRDDHEKKRRYREYDLDATEEHSKKISSPSFHKAHGEADSTRQHKTDVDKSVMEFTKHTNISSVVESSDEGTEQPAWESRSLRNDQMSGVFSSIAVDSSSNVDTSFGTTNHAPNLTCHLQDVEICRPLFRSETGVFTPSSNRSLSPQNEIHFSQNVKNRKNDDALDTETEEHEMETDARSGHSYNSTIASEVHSVDDFGVNQTSLSPPRHQHPKSFDDDITSGASPLQHKVRVKNKNVPFSQNDTLPKSIAKNNSVEKQSWENKLQTLLHLLETIDTVEDSAAVKQMMLQDLKMIGTVCEGQRCSLSVQSLSLECVNRIIHYLDP